MKSATTSQIHVRVSPKLKMAVKMFCVRSGITEQSWINTLIENELHRKVPDLWTPDTKARASAKNAKRH